MTTGQESMALSAVAGRMFMDAISRRRTLDLLYVAAMMEAGPYSDWPRPPLWKRFWRTLRS